MKIPWFNKKEKVLPHEAVLPDESATWEINVNSPTWRFIDRWSKERIDKLRRENDSPQKTEVQTAIIRGCIKELRELRALAEPGRENRPTKTEPPDDWPVLNMR